MKVTPLKKKFGKYAPGDEFDLPDKTAKVFIKIGKLMAAPSGAPTYQTRMMQAETPAVVQIESMAPAYDAMQAEQPAAEMDSAGAEWDERVHASAKTKNTDGTWRKRSGPRPADE